MSERNSEQKTDTKLFVSCHPSISKAKASTLQRSLKLTIPLQGTVARSIKITGVGLHSGCLVNCWVHPAAANTGILFKRIDRSDSLLIKADPFNITETTLSTTIGSGSSKVSTIEHLMAAFYGLGIDNAYVEIDNEEVPILDGSSAPFYDQLSVVGTKVLNAPKKSFVCEKPFEVKVGSSLMRVEPYPELFFECEIDFTSVSKAIGVQTLSFAYSDDMFKSVCEARTFCHVSDVNKMREMGLARGGSLDNAVVVDDEKVLNLEGLRFQDEFVRHKVLDCIGDLSMLGGHMVGKIILKRPGHALTAEFTKTAFMHLAEYFSVAYGLRRDVQLSSNVAAPSFAMAVNQN